VNIQMHQQNIKKKKEKYNKKEKVIFLFQKHNKQTTQHNMKKTKNIQTKSKRKIHQ